MGVFMDRVKDATKVPLATAFVGEIVQLASLNGKSEDEVWALWRKYTEDCRNFDQSPVMSEFCDWNKLKRVA